MQEKFSKATVNGKAFKVVDPSLFYSKPVKGMGLGLFCKVDLEPGDIWWAHNLNDSRYVENVYTWTEYSALPKDKKRDVELRCYVDVERRDVVICTEPFCRVNHGNINTSNSDSDEDKNSLISKKVLSDNQILISYDYEAIVSLIWKFDEFRAIVPNRLLNDETFLFSCAVDVPIARDFLSRLS